MFVVVVHERGKEGTPFIFDVVMRAGEIVWVLERLVGNVSPTC